MAEQSRVPPTDGRSPTERARTAAIEALGSLERGERDSLERLRMALCDYVGRLRADNVTAAEATEAVRDLVAAPSNPAGRDTLAAAREALTELSTLWCAEQYERRSALSERDSVVGDAVRREGD